MGCVSAQRTWEDLPDGEEPTQRCQNSADMWSLGICLFAMLAGFFPFTEAVAHNAYFTGAQKQAAAYGSLTLAVFGLYNTPPCPLSLLAVALHAVALLSAPMTSILPLELIDKCIGSRMWVIKIGRASCRERV